MDFAHRPSPDQGTTRGARKTTVLEPAAFCTSLQAASSPWGARGAQGALVAAAKNHLSPKGPEAAER